MITCRRASLSHLIVAARAVNVFFLNKQLLVLRACDVGATVQN